MKQEFRVSPAGIQRVQKKTVRQFIPLFLVIALFAFISWWFIMRPSLHFGNPKRWLPGIVMLSAAAILFVVYLFKLRKALRNIRNLTISADDLFITAVNFLGSEITVAYTDLVKIEKISGTYYLKTDNWQRFVEIYPDTERQDELLAIIHHKRPDLLLRD